jgi:hypothetical protein
LKANYREAVKGKEYVGLITVTLINVYITRISNNLISCKSNEPNSSFGTQFLSREVASAADQWADICILIDD